MRVYETTFIVNPQTDDATIDQQVVAVADLISRHGGRILQEERMGTRRLAYPIRKLTQGYYHSFIYEASQETLPELDRYFRLNDAYLRFLTLAYEGNVDELRRKATQQTEQRPEPAPAAEAAPAATPTTEEKATGEAATEETATEEVPAEQTATEQAAPGAAQPETEAPVEKGATEGPEEITVAESVPTEETGEKPEEAAEEKEPEEKLEDRSEDESDEENRGL